MTWVLLLVLCGLLPLCATALETTTVYPYFNITSNWTSPSCPSTAILGETTVKLNESSYIVTTEDNRLECINPSSDLLLEVNHLRGDNLNLILNGLKVRVRITAKLGTLKLFESTAETETINLNITDGRSISKARISLQAQLLPLKLLLESSLDTVSKWQI